MSEQREFVLTAPLGRVIWSLAWPIALSNQLSMLTMGILLYWLGRLIGETGLAVESLFRPLELLLSWGFGAVSVGASVLVSRSVGASDGKGLAITASSITLTVALWIGFAAVAIPAAPWLASTLAAGLAVEPAMLRFALGWIVVALPALAIAEVVLEVASSTGATKFNLLRVVIDLALMAILAPVLIDIAGLGIIGAPIAQGLAAAGLVVLVWLALLRRRAALALGELPRGAWRIDGSLWKSLLAIGVPVQAGRIAMFVAQLILVQRVARDGEATVAGYGIAGVLLLVGAMLTLALAQGGGITIGQSIGARELDRARRAVGVTLVTGWIVIAGFVIATLFARPIVALFTADPAVANAALDAIAILRWAAFGIATWQILLGAFAAHRVTMRASLLVIGGEAVGLVVAFTWPGSYLESVCVAYVIANVVKAVLLLVLVATGSLARARAALPAAS